MKDFYVTGAALRAGYSPKTARQIGSNLLSKVSISVALQCFYRERREESLKTVEDVEKLSEDVAFTRITDVVHITQDGLTFAKDSDDWPEHVKQAVKKAWSLLRI